MIHVKIKALYQIARYETFACNLIKRPTWQPTQHDFIDQHDTKEPLSHTVLKIVNRFVTIARKMPFTFLAGRTNHSLISYH